MPSRSSNNRAWIDQWVDDCEAQAAAIREGKIEFHGLTKGRHPGQLMDPQALPGVSGVGFWDGRTSQNWGERLHCNEGIEFAFLDSGEMGFVVNDETHALRPGNLVLTRPWQLHKFGNPHIGRGRFYWFVLDIEATEAHQAWRWPSWVMLTPNDLASFEAAVRQSSAAVMQANHRVREVFREIGACVLEWQSPLAESRLGIAINRLLVEVLAILQQAQDSPAQAGDIGADQRQKVVQLLSKLAEDVKSAAIAWTLSDMAQHCGMGVTTLTKYCGEWVNTSPMAYLTQCRVDHAARMLTEQPNLTATEVAARCGFSSSQYFATAFRRVHHLSPSAFKAAKGAE